MKRSERARTRHSSFVFRCFDAAFRCVYVSTQAVTLFFCFNSSAGKNKQTKQQKNTKILPIPLACSRIGKKR